MKRVLITGGAGFIAHHLIYFLIKHTNWEIISLDRLDYSGNLNRLNHVMSELPTSERKRLKIVFHDLKSEINPWIKKELGDINIILHLAAGSHVDRSIDYPMEFVLDNVVGTANILDYASFINKIMALKGLFILVQMRFLAQHQMELIIKRMIDIIQQIHIVLQKLEVKN